MAIGCRPWQYRGLLGLLFLVDSGHEAKARPTHRPRTGGGPWKVDDADRGDNFASVSLFLEGCRHYACMFFIACFEVESHLRNFFSSCRGVLLMVDVQSFTLKGTCLRW
ncbi:hypothetical protein DM02DRAFT_86138 [Periconia macrospinosa]|uniref:Secreted protein n=1 Tax=Periconia macrospinosa TaxID=97972 RepID=A0A2V1DH42_9PLEO|nr:hypothetical protein DM02DRAFT_86138 [Periconia macrospinosa]